MENQRFLFWFIVVITILAGVIDLPENLHLKFAFGPVNFDQKITTPKIDLRLGPIIIKKDFRTRYGLDLAGGTHLVLEADMKDISANDRERAFISAKDIVERRVNLYGLTEPVIQQSKVGESYRIIVELAGISDVNQAIDLIGKTAQLSFYEESDDFQKETTPSSYKQLWSKATALTGKNLKRSEVTFDPNTGKPQVALEFDNEGTKLFSDITTKNVGKTVAIFLDEQLLSAPRVNEAITQGKAVIQGNFSSDEAKRLSIALNAGALPVPLTVIEQKNVSATLGQESINKSLFAGAIGLSIVVLFMFLNYGFLGFIADLALIIYALLVFAIFKLVPVTLTLAGIAGFILSIGMAVDANILIFERIKEEIRWGKDKKTAVTDGFNRAFPSIKDANISSLITCVILYWFGTGMIRGFAVTLAIGIFVSLFSAITVTRTFIRLIYR